MMERDDLARWTRFAMKGGIGKCVAVSDCIAEVNGDLMFLTDDEIVVLMQVQDAEGVYLGYCEGVIGRFHAKHVSFLTKLKKPVMAKRSSVASTKSKSPTPPGTSNGPMRFKTPTPTFGLAATPTLSETPPIPGSSSASVRTDSRASVGQQYWKSPPQSPVNTTFSMGGSSSNRSSGATGWRAEGERRDGLDFFLLLGRVGYGDHCRFNVYLDDILKLDTLEVDQRYLALAKYPVRRPTSAFVLLFRTTTATSFASTCIVTTTSPPFSSKHDARTTPTAPANQTVQLVESSQHARTAV
ncbi:hypothetical protein H1R20_g13386, partial [Candolleomyces eurysporus]